MPSDPRGSRRTLTLDPGSDGPGDIEGYRMATFVLELRGAPSDVGRKVTAVFRTRLVPRCGADDETLTPGSSQLGGMLWLIRNRFSGSYFRLTATSRSYFAGP